jgi:hypothetical protein
MSHAIVWLFDNPIADLITVGMLVSVVLHIREVRLIQKRMTELEFLVGKLEMFIRTMS